MLTFSINILSTLQILGAIIGAAAVFGILALLVSKIRRWFASRAFNGLDRKEFRRRWQEVEQLAP